MSNISIRLYRSSDAKQIAQLFYETVHTVNAKDYSREQLDAWAPKELDTAGWERALFPTIAFVAQIGKKIVGFADFLPDGFLCHLYVHKDHQRQGIATLLLAEVEKTAKAQGLASMQTEASITARPFFESQGYMAGPAQQKRHNNQIFINYPMRKRLN